MKTTYHCVWVGVGIGNDMVWPVSALLNNVRVEAMESNSGVSLNSQLNCCNKKCSLLFFMWVKDDYSRNYQFKIWTPRWFHVIPKVDLARVRTI